jgi:hypothetical protein
MNYLDASIRGVKFKKTNSKFQTIRWIEKTNPLSV